MASLPPVVTTLAGGKVTGAVEENKPPTRTAKLSVSAAGIFQSRSDKSINATTAKTVPNAGVKRLPGRGENGDVLPDKDYHPKTPHNSKDSACSSAKHPLVVSFNEATGDYRTAVYEAVTSKIDDTHDSLVKELHDSSLSRLANPNDDEVPPSPLKPTRATHLMRETEYLYLPLGATALSFTHQGEDGEQTAIKMSLEERLASFEEHVRTEEKEIMMLQTQWERVLGEIWNCGVQLLGKERMSELLNGREQPGAQEETSLFVPEGGDDQRASTKGKGKDKKRVSFRHPTTPSLPAFLEHPPSAARKVPCLPATPAGDVRSLEKAIDRLGAQQVKDLKRLAQEQEKWFQAKITQLLAVWETEI